MEVFISNASWLGLILDIIGAGLLWVYGITATIDHPEFNLVMKNSLVVSGDDGLVRDSKKQIKIVKRWSKLGLFLLVIGFLFQALGNYTSSDTISELKRVNIELLESSSVQDERLVDVTELYLKSNQSVGLIESKLITINNELNELKKTNTQLVSKVESYNKKIQLTQKTRS
ncbi:MAG: hypothetical protein RPR97_10415 [Colwellia sp.]